MEGERGAEDQRQADGRAADEKRVLDGLDDALVLDEREIGAKRKAVPLHGIVLELEEREEDRHQQRPVEDDDDERGEGDEAGASGWRAADYNWCLARWSRPGA